MTETPRIFLDLDGTLVDPAYGIIGSIRHALAEVGANVPEAETLGWCIGPPLHESLTELAGDEVKGAEALEVYRARYQAGAMFEARVYDGIPQALAEMRARGWRLFLATSKPIVFAAEITSRFGARLIMLSCFVLSFCFLFLPFTCSKVLQSFVSAPRIRSELK